MTKKTTDILAYITIFGLIIAFVAGDREASKFHLNQALVIWLIGIIAGVCAVIPLVGWVASAILGIVAFVDWVIGLIGAVQGTENPAPLIGSIQLLK